MGQFCMYCGKFAWSLWLARRVPFIRRILVEPHLCESCWLESK